MQSVIGFQIFNDDLSGFGAIWIASIAYRSRFYVKPVIRAAIQNICAIIAIDEFDFGRAGLDQLI